MQLSFDNYNLDVMKDAKSALNTKLINPSNSEWANTAIPDGLFDSKD